MTFHHKESRGITRRRLIQAGGTVAALTLTGCGFLEPDVDDPGTQETGAGSGPEAPELAARVKDGDLPAVAERLPAEPVVIQPVERIGQYGGTWRTALLGPADAAWLDQLLSEPMVRWDKTMNDLLPNVAASYEGNDDGSEYTFHLREGLKWSDGAPLTADDIVFAQNDVYNNKDISVVGDNPVKAKKINDLTVSIILSEPNALYVETSLGGGLLNKPKHYLEKFHKKYNPDVDKLVEEEGVADWVELFQRKGGTIEGTPYNAMWQNPELPRLHAWLPSDRLGDKTTATFIRNPFYWKVDPENRQLPYINEIKFEIINDEEVMLLNAQDGQFDMHFRHFNTPQNKPVLADNGEKGGYRFFETQPAIMNNSLIIFNLTHKDPVKREIFNNLDFRIGLSHALNRDEIVKVVNQRQGEPWQAAPRKESPYYDEEFAKQYTEYSVEKANSYLDKAGYKKDGSGRRIGPNGKPIAFNLAFSSGSTAKPEDTLQLVRGYWQAVGIDARLKSEERSLLASRNESNDSDVFAWEGDGGLNPTQVPDWYFPDPAYLTFARGWSDWYGEVPDGSPVEPPAPIKKQMALYDKILLTTDRDEQIQHTKEILQIAKENFLVMGTVLTPPSYGIATNKFRNVPTGILDPAQVFFQIDACQCFFQ